MEDDGEAPGHEEQPRNTGLTVRPGEQVDADGNVDAAKTKRPRPQLTYGHLTVRIPARADPFVSVHA